MVSSAWQGLEHRKDIRYLLKKGAVKQIGSIAFPNSNRALSHQPPAINTLIHRGDSRLLNIELVDSAGRPAKWARVGAASADHLGLLTDKGFGLDRPSVVISVRSTIWQSSDQRIVPLPMPQVAHDLQVTGGAALNFKIKEELRVDFERGLQQVVKVTSAW